jgi:hypothetical protein
MKIKSFLFIFLLSSSIVHALNQQKIDLSEHGADLKKAPFVVRYKFDKKYHKDWQHSTYQEREVFLTEWYYQQIEHKKTLDSQKEKELNAAKALEIERKLEKKRLAAIEKANKMAAKEEYLSKKVGRTNINRQAKEMKRELETLQGQK